MVCGLCGVEAIGFGVFEVRLCFSDLGLSLIVGALAVSAYGAGSGILLSFIGGKANQFLPRFTMLGASLLLPYVIIVFRLHSFAFSQGPLWQEILAAAVLFGLMIAVGRFGWIYLDQGDSDLAWPRFQALAPVSVFCAGLYSVADSAIGKPGLTALAVLGILALFVAGQYLLARLIWARKWSHRWGVRIHLLVIISASVAAAVGSTMEYRNQRRPATASENLPPVILITIDTLRADFLSPYNPQAAFTPAAQSLAKNGIRFAHAVAPSSWTPPSVASMMTGLYPSACGSGILNPINQKYDYTGVLPKALCIAQVFKDQGYATAAFGQNGWLSRRRGYDKGFDVYEIINAPEAKPGFLIAKGAKKILTRTRSRKNSAGLSRRAKRWLRSRPPGPFFLWLHYVDPHLPYDAHEKYPAKTKPGPMTKILAKDSSSARIRARYYNFGKKDKMFMRERYEGEVRFNDENLLLLFDELKKLGLYDKSVIALSSDHGEEFWEHDGFEHGHSFHVEVVEVPLIIKLAGNERMGRTVDSWVSLSRLGATLFAAAGIKAEFPGKSLLSCLDDAECSDTETPSGFWLSERTLSGTDRGAVGDHRGHKAIMNGDGAITCYDLAHDPQEQEPFPESLCPWPRNTPAPREIFKAFEQQNHKIFLALDGDKAIQKPPTKGNIKQLKDLGYIQ